MFSLAKELAFSHGTFKDIDDLLPAQKRSEDMLKVALRLKGRNDQSTHSMSPGSNKDSRIEDIDSATRYTDNLIEGDLQLGDDEVSLKLMGTNEMTHASDLSKYTRPKAQVAIRDVQSSMVRKISTKHRTGIVYREVNSECTIPNISYLQ